MTEKVHVKDLSIAEKLKIIGRTAAGLNKKYDRPDLVVTGDLIPDTKEHISFGDVQLDRATGGGAVRGGCNHWFGPTSSGKTTNAFKLIASAQKQGFICGFIDAERAFDKLYATKIGVDVDKLIFVEPETMEEGLTAILEFAKSGAMDLCIYDSFVSMAPKSEMERDLEQNTMALIARAGSQFFRMFTAYCSRANMCAVFLNQMRTDMGSYGSPDASTGGKAIKFYALMELGIRRGPRSEWPTEGKEIVGFTQKVKIHKTKVSGTMHEGEEVQLTYKYETGMDSRENVAILAKQVGILRPVKAGSSNWMIDNYNSGEVIAKGKDNIIPAILANEDLYTIVLDKVNAWLDDPNRKILTDEPTAESMAFPTVEEAE